jgi:hypothetical protein
MLPLVDTSAPERHLLGRHLVDPLLDAVIEA